MSGTSLGLGDSGGGNALAEQRRHRRLPCSRPIDILPFDGPFNTRFRRVKLIDCSIGGLALISDMMMAVNDNFVAKLKLDTTTALAMYRVRHCRPVDGAMYRIGAELCGVVGPVSSANSSDPAAILKALINGDEPISD